ncbi:MAG: Uridylate kinase [Chlamydiae bacterium]|nr:Uridylate kinase [Chlamydiota bacterium]
MTNSSPSYKRILLKLSGESLVSENSKVGVEFEACRKIAESIKEAQKLNVEIGIVIGGGNFFRGHVYCKELNMPQAKADQVGMLATLMNGITLQRALLNVGCPTKLMSAFPCGAMAELFNADLAKKYLEENQVVIFAGGTGNPFFTTDTAASLRACEIQANALLKATKVDGVFDKDPKVNSDAQKYDQLSYNDVLEKDLKVMDATAITLCREHQIPIVVFNMYKENNIRNVIQKKSCGTRIEG